MLSLTIVHELAHAVSMEIGKAHMEVWDLPTPEKAYFWQNVVKTRVEVASKNAENYCYFGLMALLADKGYTIVPSNAKGITKEHWETYTLPGWLFYEPGITKRSLMPTLFTG